PADLESGDLGIGRANNLLRHIYGMPLKEEAELQQAQAEGGELASAQAALKRAVRPALPRRLALARLQGRLAPAATGLLTCGNTSLMADIRTIADANGARFEKEDW